MRIAIAVDSDAALLAGRDVSYGDVIVDVPIEALDGDDRQALVDGCQIPKRDRTPDGPAYRAGDSCPVDGIQRQLPPVAEATVETLRRRLAAIRAMRAAAAAKNLADYEADVAELLAADSPEQWAKTDDGNWTEYSPPFTRYNREHGYPSQDPRVAPHAQAMRDVIAPRVEEYDRKVAEAKARREAAKKSREDEARADRQGWIGENGSDRLQRLLAEAIEHDAVYYDERLAADRPGWRWYRDVPGRIDEPRNPPADALALLDEARRIAPDAGLQYYVIDDDETGEMLETGYVAADDYLGRQIVFGAEAVEAAAD